MALGSEWRLRPAHCGRDRVHRHRTGHLSRVQQSRTADPGTVRGRLVQPAHRPGWRRAAHPRRPLRPVVHVLERELHQRVGRRRPHGAPAADRLRLRRRHHLRPPPIDKRRRLQYGARRLRRPRAHGLSVPLPYAGPAGRHRHEHGGARRGQRPLLPLHDGRAVPVLPRQSDSRPQLRRHARRGGRRLDGLAGVLRKQPVLRANGLHAHANRRRWRRRRWQRWRRRRTP